MATVLRRNPITEFGEFLRAARERRGLTLQQLAQATKIPPRHLDAIEHGDLTAVPAGLYRRAEVRAYAKAVGLDQNEAIAHLREAQPDEPPAPAAVQINELDAPGHPWLVTVALLGVIAALVGLIAWPRPDGASAEPATRAAAPVATAASSAATAPPPASTANPVRSTQTLASPAAGTAAPADAADTAPATAPAISQLTVTSYPSGARVVVDGIGRGSTPLTIEYLTLGAKQVRIIRDGYRSEERSVRLTSAHPTVNLHVELQPAQ
jgi:cytoskeletal protein RodZ